MRTIGILAVSVGLLSACSGGNSADSDGDGVLSREELTAAASDAVKPDPGQYRSTMELLSVDLPGAPEGVADMMKNSMSSQTSEYCLSPEDVDKGFEQMAAQSQEGGCVVKRFDIDGGSFEADMTCGAGELAEMRMSMKGTGTETSAEMFMDMEGEMPGLGAMTMKMKINNERIGDCP